MGEKSSENIAEVFKMETLVKLAIIIVFILLLSLEYFTFLGWKELKNKGSKTVNKVYVIHLSSVLIAGGLYGAYIVYPPMEGFAKSAEVLFFLIFYIAGSVYTVTSLLMVIMSHIMDLEEAIAKKRLTGSSR